MRRAYRCTRGHVTELVESLDGPTLGRCPEPTTAIKLSGAGAEEVPWNPCGAPVERCHPIHPELERPAATEWMWA